MRRNLAKLPYPVIGRATAADSSASAGFSTSSAGGGGRGRGGWRPLQFAVDEARKNESDNSKFEDAPPPHGHGRGRGQPLPSSPILPSFSSLLNNDPKAPPIGRGRGFVPPKTVTPPPRDTADSTSKFQNIGNKAPLNSEAQFDSPESTSPARRDKNLLTEISSILHGSGRGKPMKATTAPAEKAQMENRHIRARPQPKAPEATRAADSPQQSLSQEEKVKKAMGILTRGEPEGGRGGAAAFGGRGRADMRGRGRGRFSGRGGRGRGRGEEEDEDLEDIVPVGLTLGGPEDEEKLAKKLGPKVMNELAEEFEEMSYRALPSPIDDAFVDAHHTNLLLECEPEYLMEEFGTNPDIDEKPPIPLRDALEKMKPFLMAYEGIESQEEWEEIMEETMKTVPLMKKIVNYYSGPDRITAKQQQEKLERIAKTLPASAPASVKNFTDRAVLSLQSNPGWGFNKKRQFMKMLVNEVSEQYK
ncbi:uncharacterized protein LOC127254671 [Andrographis paniculata]|uniref:uncharacterized protein LOC127254671 n=1 Tax=Andrographis paniculata TaxID=175694 RepID=UPI0021E79124|nr:uncharacterized protein LOC127254671 [Andrographis paniculata]